MRTYPPPFRKENYIVLPVFKIPAAAPSVEHIKSVSKAALPVRTNMPYVSPMWLIGFGSAYLLSRWENKYFMRYCSIESLVSTNINGPKEAFFFAGHEVTDMIVYAGPMF
jgi:hypothetical protein